MHILTEVNKHGIPGEAESFWIASSAGTGYPALSRDTTVDIAIVGGGFVGITSALLLKEAGLKVAVLEAREILRGVTGYTTAKVTSLHRLIYKHLIDAFGDEPARQFAEANQSAIGWIEAVARERNISCDFSRLPFYTFAETDKYLPKIEDEVKAAQRLGLPASFVQNVPLPFATKGAVRFEDQAQFHPRKFLLALASMIPGDDSFIFEHTRVSDIEEGEPCTLITEKGKIQAGKVIIATNFPVHDKSGLYFARLEVKRSYVLGIKVKGPFAGGMYINAEETGHSFRAQPVEGGEILIIGGEDHTTGHETNTVKRYQSLVEYVGKVYDNPQVEYSWSTQDNISLDKVPYIGKLIPVSKHLFVATGFGQWGMTSSVAAAMILTDLVRYRPNPWAGVFDPCRLKPDASAARKLVTQNLKVIKKLVGGHVSGKEDVSQISPGEGKIVEVDKQRAAAYRDEQGKLYVLSPNCTHMGCVVAWNNAERTWDCPCHGSRYDFNGEVIQSPTVKGLSLIQEHDPTAKQTETRIASTADLPPGKMMSVKHQDKDILIANVDGTYYAIGNVCTHRGCSLSEGALKGEKIKCRCHGSMFDLRTGEVVQGPAQNPEPVYKLRIEGDQILLVI